MNLRYKIAVSIGISAGFVSLVVVAFTNMLSPLGEAWNIPQWDVWQQKFRPEMQLLQCQAAFFRICMLFLQHGFQFIAIPTFLSCAVAKLDEMGDQNRILRCLSKSLMTTVFLVLVVSFFWGMIGGTIGTTDVLPVFQFQLRSGIGAWVFLLFCAVFSGIAPAFWLLLFLIYLLPESQI